MIWFRLISLSLDCNWYQRSQKMRPDEVSDTVCVGFKVVTKYVEISQNSFLY